MEDEEHLVDLAEPLDPADVQSNRKNTDCLGRWHNFVQYGFTASHHRIYIHSRGQARNVIRVR